MKTIIITIFFLLLSGCNFEIKKPYNLVPTAGTDRGCCCENFEGEEYEISRWMCSRPPYERGACLPNRKTRCGKKHHHRRHHSTRNPDDDDRDFIKQNFQRSRKYEVLNH